ncbi:MAG: NusG domain II-containing protein [Agathobacter sp.]|nr:NusG domain II-containing protein [Agathobacter sp.]MBQ3559116.1 NusG domain II-containing protein [Agathobacter sp.]
MNRRFGKNDVIFIGFLALFCIAVCVWVYKGGAVEGSNIVITVDGKEYGTYSLLEEQTITIGEGETINIIEIKGGKAYMKEASCPDQLCVDQNEISFDKEAIICLPNKVVITVISDVENDVDAIIR